MILTGSEINNQFNDGHIHISPFDASSLNPNSYDIRLGNNFLTYTDPIVDTRSELSVKERQIGDDQPLTLDRGEFILGASKEFIGSNKFVPIIHAKSGIARCGIFVHVTANLIDIGSRGQITFQIFATIPVTIYPGMKFAQISFWKPEGKILLYDGKYQGSKGPCISKSYQDV